MINRWARADFLHVYIHLFQIFFFYWIKHYVRLHIVKRCDGWKSTRNRIGMVEHRHACTIVRLIRYSNKILPYIQKYIFFFALPSGKSSSSSSKSHTFKHTFARRIRRHRTKEWRRRKKRTNKRTHNNLMSIEATPPPSKYFLLEMHANFSRIVNNISWGLSLLHLSS